MFLLLLFVSATYAFQIPFVNVKFDMPSLSFPRFPFTMPSIGANIFDQPNQDMSKMENESENNIFSDLSGVPDMSIDPKKIKTKTKIKVKDGFKETETTKTGPGFYSYITEIHNDNNKTNGSMMDFSSTMMNADNMLGGMLNGIGGLRGIKGMKKKCNKKCTPDQYCDPFFGKCRSKLLAGSKCMLMNQCQQGLMCVYGRCNKAIKGAPGTFCKRKDQCLGEACCVKQDGSFHAICTPPLDEGAVCGEQMMSDIFMRMLPIKNKKEKPTKCVPCKIGLKCANVGDPKFKRCVPANYIEESVEKSRETLEEDNGVSGSASGEMPIPQNEEKLDEPIVKKNKEKKKKQSKKHHSGKENN